jgi:hypothetical protein
MASEFFTVLNSTWLPGFPTTSQSPAGSLERFLNLCSSGVTIKEVLDVRAEINEMRCKNNTKKINKIIFKNKQNKKTSVRLRKQKEDSKSEVQRCITTDTT